MGYAMLLMRCHVDHVYVRRNWTYEQMLRIIERVADYDRAVSKSYGHGKVKAQKRVMSESELLKRKDLWNG